MHQGLSTQQSIYTNAHYADKIRQHILAERHIVYYGIKLAEALEGLENSMATQPMYQHTVRAFPNLSTRVCVCMHTPAIPYTEGQYQISGAC